MPLSLANRLRRRVRAVPLVLLTALPATAYADQDGLDTVLVTADRIPVPRDLTGSAVSLITGDDLQKQQQSYVADALRTLPGVEVDNTGGPGGTTSVMLRGFDGKNVKVLIDGIDVADPSGAASQFDFADLLTADIDRIEVVRGAQSTLYGSDAMGGVINVVTKSGRTDPGGEVMAEDGSYGTAGGSAALRGLVGALDYSASLAGVHTDGIIAADQKNGNTQHDAYDNITATLKLGLPVDDWLDLGTVFRYVDARHDYPGYSFATGLPADDPGQVQATREIYGRATAAMRFLDGRLQNVVGVGASEIDRDYLLDNVVQDYYRGKTDQEDDQATLNALPWLNAVAGFASKAEYYHDNTGLSAEQRIDGYYGELEAQPIDAFALTAGVRHDQVEGGAGATTWRTTLSYRPFEDGPRFHGSAGTGFKAPSLYELFVTSPYVLGDPHLQPERSTGWDAGLEQELPLAHTVVDVTWFANDIRDLIDGYTDANYVFHYANIDHARTYGLEATLTAKPTETLSLQGSYTYLRTNDLTDGGELLRRPHHTLAGSVTWQATEKLQTFLRASWVSARLDDDFAYGAPPVVPLAPYALLAFGGAYQLTDGWSLFGRMENALNRHYEEVVGYGVAGRAVYGGVKVTF